MKLSGNKSFFIKSIGVTTIALCLVLASACAKKNVAAKPGGADAGATTSDGSGIGGSTLDNGAGGANGGAGSGSMDAMNEAAAGGKLLTVYFEYDRATLDDAARAELKKHYQYLNKNGKTNIIVEGHCDNRGTDEYNLALGERRAKAIKDYLVNLGIAANRLSTISYGEERPAIQGDSESAWSKNRRGEFVISK